MVLVVKPLPVKAGDPRDMGFPGGSNSKEPTCNAGNPGMITMSGRFPGEGNVNPFQYSCFENSMDKGAWQAPVHGVPKGGIRLSN